MAYSGTLLAFGPAEKQGEQEGGDDQIVIMYENGEFKKEIRGLRTRPASVIDPETGKEAVREEPVVKIECLCTSSDGKPVPWREAKFIEIYEYDKNNRVLYEVRMVRQGPSRK